MSCFSGYIFSKKTDLSAVFGQKKLTYSKLSDQSMALSVILKKNYEVRPRDLVGIMMEKSDRLLVAMHSIWLSQSAFVPLDPKLPEERLLHMVKDSGIRTIITESPFLITISRLSCKLGSSLFIKTFILDHYVQETLVCNNYPDSFNKKERPLDSLEAPAYVIYTSGTTGAPKGVVCSHKGLLNLCKTYVVRHKINASTRTLQFSNIGFDASIAEIFPTLYGGGTLYFGSRDDTAPGEKLKEFIKIHKINYISLPPTILGEMSKFVKELGTLKTVISAGEPLLKNIARHWINDKLDFYNAYGPSEVTICATMHKVDSIGDDVYDSVTIGKPIENVKIKVMRSEENSTDYEQCGELLVSGDGVINNYYINNPELNKEKFINFSKEEGVVYYKTGDKVVQNSDGYLFFVGRSQDGQVKIRGFRVQLEAIENVICCFPGISTASVKVVSKGKSKYISAYYCTKDGGIDISELREFLKEKLPHYMIPNYYTHLDIMPLKSNMAKVDKSALPLPKELQEEKINIVSSEKSIDEFLINKDNLEVLCIIFDKIFKKAVGTTNPDDNFFEAGGDSLSVASLVESIKKYLHFDLLIAVVYENPTPRKLLEVCLNLQETAEQNVVDIEKFVHSLNCSANCDEIHFNGKHFDKSGPKNIFLTGGTGFLGVHLIEDLDKNDRVNKIYCLIRAHDKDHALERLKKSFDKYKLELGEKKLKKVIFLAGDLENKKFGLTKDDFDFLSKEVDIILHSAADINYISSYSSIEKANVESVKNLVKFSTNVKIKEFHYISTLAVLGAGTLTKFQNIYEDFSLDLSAPVLHFENAYTQSKWVGEKLLNNLAKKGIRTNIYRPGFIQGHSLTGASNTTDLFCRLLMGSIQAGFYPYYPFKYWLPVPVDYVSSAIAFIVCSEQKLGKIYHLISNNEFSHNEIFEYIASLGYKMDKISPKKWLEKLTLLKQENHLFPLVNFLTQKVYYNQETILDVHHYTPKVHDFNTREALKLSNIEIPNFDETLIKKSLNFFRNEGYI